MSQRTILIVDDEPALRRVLSRGLEHAGYRTLTAGSGEEATGVLEQHEVDLVIADLRMPGMSGQTLYHIIASQWPHLVNRVVVMSGDTESEQLKAWLDIHDLPVLPKPFEFSYVLRLVESLTEGRRHEANGP
jgi:DNA-binding NtrC family response regulator